MKTEGTENKNSLLAICRSSEAAGGARSNCYEFFGSFCRYKKNEEKLLSPAANDNPELFQHYFNANHLGSGSLITDESGATYQTLAYAPHGDLLVNEINGNYDEPYKFTGYERDQESGLDYAHARYYYSNGGYDISTDPKWYLSPNKSSYLYASNNPIMRIDPDGNFDFQPETYTDQQLADMGLTRADLERFTKIVNNISNIVGKDVMTAITNTTGLDQSIIQYDITAGQGPKVTITNDNTLLDNFDARGTRDGGVFLSSLMIKYLASIDPAYMDGDELIGQTVGVAMTILHEYGHVGDQKKNHGNNSGQFDPNDGRNYKDIFGGNNIVRGEQTWNNGMSGTGHRGEDIELYGFGFKVGAMVREGPNAGRLPVRIGEVTGGNVRKIYKRLMGK